MAEVSAAAARKLARIDGDFLALTPEEQLVFVRELRARRRKPVPKAKPPKIPKPPKEPKQPKAEKTAKPAKTPRKRKGEPTDAELLEALRAFNEKLNPQEEPEAGESGAGVEAGGEESEA